MLSQPIKIIIQNNLHKNVAAQLNCFMQADEVAADSDDDPEELLAHPDHAANPGEEGQWLNVKFGLRLHNFSVKVYEQTKSVRPGVKRHLCSFVPSTFILLKSVIYL